MHVEPSNAEQASGIRLLLVYFMQLIYPHL